MLHEGWVQYRLRSEPTGSLGNTLDCDEQTHLAEEQQPAEPAAPPQPSAPSGEQHCWVEEAGAGGPVEGHLTGKLRKSLQVSLVWYSGLQL